MKNHTVLREVTLGAGHRATGGTRHYRGGAELPPPAALRIIKFVGDSGYYLLYLDKEGFEMTDTYHDSVEEAMAQADWEFQVKPHDWNIVTPE